MAAHSNHPFSSAIAEFARERGIDLESQSAAQSRVSTLPGRGIVATLAEGRTAWLGNVRLMHENDLALSPRLAKAVILAESQARSLACVGWEGHVRGIFVLSEEIRPDARSPPSRVAAKWGCTCAC